MVLRGGSEHEAKEDSQTAAPAIGDLIDVQKNNSGDVQARVDWAADGNGDPAQVDGGHFAADRGSPRQPGSLPDHVD